MNPVFVLMFIFAIAHAEHIPTEILKVFGVC